MKEFVIGDIHGAHKALVQCLQFADFDYDADLLICLGDICDGFPDVPACMDELLKIKNLVLLMGNHDQWFLEWAAGGKVSEAWYHQGGKRTIESYDQRPPASHTALLQAARGYYLMGQDLFVHGGMEPGVPLNEQDPHTLMWDRKLVMEAFAKKDKPENISGYERVFVGHTPTIRFKSLLPLQLCEIILMDTGAGWGQKLSILELATGKVFQSDTTESLYGVSFTR